MKLLTYALNGKQKVGILTEDEKYIVPIEEAGLHYTSMNALICNISEAEKEALKAFGKNVLANEKKLLSMEEVTLCAPIPEPRQDVICLGINYMAHAKESAKFKKEDFNGERPHAIYFSKRVNEAVPSGSSIPSYKELMQSLDYEVELAVIIGKTAKNVKKEEAFDYVFGYTIINDISAREIQMRHKQWYFAKSFDGFLPMGPCIVTEDCFERPPILKITSRVNGELRQNASTDLLIFDIPHVIHELSQGMTLKAGTIIAMGTPAGVGMGFDPPKFLKTGDEIVCEIEKIGQLTTLIGN